ncbi:MAG: acyl-CoA thioesterase [Crocinitomicaceae bacterium]|jgi:acyl-CoA thioesterase
MSPQEIVDQMMEKDAFSKWLEVDIVLIDKGVCELTCTVRDEMLNGHQIAHGGITYSLSDSALAFASNAYGQKCLSIETSIAHVHPVNSGDLLHVQCKELYRGKTIGIYTVSVHNQDDEIVSRFKGTVHISDKVW